MLLDELLHDLVTQQEDVIGCHVNFRGQNSDSIIPNIADAFIAPNFVLH